MVLSAGTQARRGNGTEPRLRMQQFRMHGVSPDTPRRRQTELDPIFALPPRGVLRATVESRLGGIPIAFPGRAHPPLEALRAKTTRTFFGRRRCRQRLDSDDRERTAATAPRRCVAVHWTERHLPNTHDFAIKHDMTAASSDRVQPAGAVVPPSACSMKFRRARSTAPWRGCITTASRSAGAVGLGTACGMVPTSTVVAKIRRRKDLL